jgi:hypothetical protein
MSKFTVGTFTFGSKKEAMHAIRDILHNTQPDTHLTGADLELIVGLVNLHERADQKIGPGIASISVRVIEFGQPGFWIHRVDGTSTDISYRKALARPSRHGEVRAVMRRAVADSVVAYKRALFADRDTVLCPITGETLSRSHGEVDHVKPFNRIADEFLANFKINPEDVEFTSCDGQIGSRLVSPLHEMWVDWHHRSAEFRYVHPDANRRRAS